MEWTSVNDDLPETESPTDRYSKEVLIYLKDGDIDIAYFDFSDGSWDVGPNRSYEWEEVTHWMPRPDPPMVDTIKADLPADKA